MGQDKFKNKYRIPSARLENWNYGWAAAYFITICTKSKEHFFGEIKNEVMYLSEMGKIAESEWLKTPKIRADMNLLLDKFVIMPNHFHAIIMIGDNKYNVDDEINVRRDAMHGSSTDVQYKNKFGPQRKNISSIIRGFKSAVTVQSRQINKDFGWQALFHDHIIRSNESYYKIRNYICNNPKNWLDDEFYSC